MSKSVLKLLFGPLSEYVKTVHTYQPEGVGELSKAHGLIKLYAYDNTEDALMSASQQVRGTKHAISSEFIKAIIGCSQHLHAIDKSATSGSNVRRVVDMINKIIMTPGSVVHVESQEEGQEEQEEQATSWEVSEVALAQIKALETLAKSQKDTQSEQTVQQALGKLGDQCQAENIELATTEFTSRVSGLISQMFDVGSQRGTATDVILRTLKSASQEDVNIFNLFFTVFDTTKGHDPVLPSEINLGALSKYRINAKSVTSLTGAWENDKVPVQSGGVVQRIPLYAFYLPTLGEEDFVRNNSGVLESIGATGKSILRIMAAGIFYNDSDSDKLVRQFGTTTTVLSLSGEAQMKYIACSDKPTNIFRTAQSAVNPPELNLTRDYWVKRTDGKYERKQLDGSYKVLTPEECDDLTNSNCVASLVSRTHCSDFIKAVVNGDISQLKPYLAAGSFSWEEAEKDLNQMKPNVVLEILKAFGFGPYTNSFGTEKQMCSVEDWLKQPETVKNFAIGGKKVEIDGKLKSYLELLVAFVNKNKSILNPHLQKQATGSVPEEVTRFGVYDGTIPIDNTYPKSGCDGPINWSQLRNTTATFAGPQFCSTSVFDPMNPMAYLSNLPGQSFPGQSLFGLGQYQGGGGQRGGALFSQQGVTEVSASSDIKMQLDSVIQMLKQSNKGLSQEDEASLNKKVASFTQLEQELWEQLCKLNRFRECLSMCGDTTPSTVLLRDLDELVQKYKHTGAKYNTNNDCLQNLCYMLTQLLTQNTTKGAPAITPLQ